MPGCSANMFQEGGGSTLGFIDDENLFIAGGSAGGIATAYAVGLTDRFNGRRSRKVRRSKKAKKSRKSKKSKKSKKSRKSRKSRR